MSKIRTARMEKLHVPGVTAAERTMCVRTCQYPDDAPIHGTYEVLEPWAWTESKICEAVSRFTDRAGLMNDTRAWVAQIETKELDPRTGKKESVWPVCGGMIYELQENGYEILLLNCNVELTPLDGNPGAFEVLSTLLNVVLEKAKKSPARTKVSIHIPDGYWTMIRFFMSLKWKPQRKDSYWEDGNDSWYFEFETSKDKEQPCIA